MRELSWFSVGAHRDHRTRTGSVGVVRTRRSHSVHVGPPVGEHSILTKQCSGQARTNHAVRPDARSRQAVDN